MKQNPRAWKWIAAFVMVLAAIIGANLILNWMGTLPGIAIRNVSIKGDLKHVESQAMQSVVKRAVRGNFFTVDVRAVRAEFERVPWVRAASVRRVWPDTLEVSIEEHEALARWGDDGLVNTHGEIFRAGYDGELPRFVGPQGSEKEVSETYAAFREILKSASLKPAEILLSPRRAWQVKLATGMTLDLGRVDMHRRLARFVAVNQLVPELQDRRGRADLRYPNGFALKLARPAAKEETSKRKKTQ
jgi:cell division protein FtsQ